MPAIKLHHRDAELSMPQTVLRLACQAERALSDLLGNCSRVAIIDFANGDHPGEDLASLGILHQLGRLRRKVVCIQSTEDYDPQVLKRKRPDCVLIQGSAPPEVFANSTARRMQMISDLRWTKIVQLPQCIYALDDIFLTYAGITQTHPDFTALAPDRMSYNRLESAGIKNIRTCPDLAFSCPVQQVATSIATKPAVLLRSGSQDTGSRIGEVSLPDPSGCLAQWRETRTKKHSPLKRLCQKSETLNRHLLSAGARRQVLQAIQWLTPYQNVITDQPYGAVLSYLMGKHTMLLKHPNRNIQETLDAWLPDCPSFTKSESADDALRSVRSVASEPSIPGQILIAVFSCQKNRMTRLPLIRKSWAAKLPANVTIKYFIGGHALPTGEALRSDEVLLSCPDSYDELPKKTRALLQYCLGQFEFDHLVKIDDDTQVMDLPALLHHATQGDYVGALKGHTSNPLHHLRRANSVNPNPVPTELLQSEFMEGSVYALSRTCASYIADLPASEIKELQEPVAYEDRMIGRLITEAPYAFTIYNVASLVRRCYEPAINKKNILTLTGAATIARTDYTLGVQRLVATLQKFVPGRLIESTWNLGVTVFNWILRRLQ